MSGGQSWILVMVHLVLLLSFPLPDPLPDLCLYSCIGPCLGPCLGPCIGSCQHLGNLSWACSLIICHLGLLADPFLGKALVLVVPPLQKAQVPEHLKCPGISSF